MNFRALETFDSEEMKSGYVKGFTYTIRTPELERCAAVWLEEGKIELVETGSRTAGSGKVY